MLKADREIFRENIRYTCETVADQSDILMVTTAGSGVLVGDRHPKASLVANPSGSKVAGMLMHNVVNVDETRYQRNPFNGERKVGEVCTLLEQGIVTVDNLKSGDSPTDGDTAYVTLNGEITKTMSATGGLVATPKVGQFKGAKDESNFVCVQIAVPIL